MPDDYIYITGKIIGNKPEGKIVVETPERNIYILDRFAVIRMINNDGLCMFGLLKKEAENCSIYSIADAK